MRAEWEMRRSLVSAALAICSTLCWPTAASAATAEVHESRGDFNSVKLEFKGAPGESNRLTVSAVGESGEHYELRLLDSAVTINAGSGCSGGGSPGVPVDCTVHKPASPQVIQCSKFGCGYVPGTGWNISMHFVLGDGGSHLDAASIPDSKEIPLTVAPGTGDDVVVTGAGDDIIGASTGNDTVRTGAGEDEFKGGPASDGADDVDLDPGFDTFDYRERSSAIAFSDDQVANDGASGEQDKLVGSEKFSSGSGDDLLEGSAAPAFGDMIDGGDGDDLIQGGPSSNILDGGGGDDRIYGKSSHDLIRGGEGADEIYGGEGGDEIDSWSSNDLVLGGPGNDRLELGWGDDSARGGGGHDYLTLDHGADTATGDAGSDLLLGEEGRDVLRGGRGADGLIGGPAQDSLNGGTGGDEIVSGTKPYSFSREAFLYSPGPIENVGDEVRCGLGLDRAGIDRVDATSGCEVLVRLRRLELFGLSQATDHSPARLSYEVRSAGVVSIGAPGLKPHHERVDPGIQPFYSAPLRLTGRAKRTLRRKGQATIHAKLVLHLQAGGEVTRFRTLTLVARR